MAHLSHLTCGLESFAQSDFYAPGFTWSDISKISKKLQNNVDFIFDVLLETVNGFV